MNAEAVSAILKEGTLISIRLGGSLSWYTSIVYKSEGRILYAALSDKLPQEGVGPGNPISVKYVNEYFIYAFEGVVARVSRESPAYVALQIASADEIINNRLSPRYDVNLEASLKPVWDSDSYPATVTDISFGGIAFICRNVFDYNDELDVDIPLHKDQNIKARGKIIRKSSKSRLAEYSLQFSHVDEAGCRILSQYFTHLEEESGRLYEYYTNEIKRKNHPFRLKE